MWTKHDPPPKRKYTGKIKVSQGANTTLARARAEVPGGTGSTVLYRDHVKGYVHYDKRLQRSIDVALPKPLYKTLDAYAGIPDERVPPLIAVMRKRRELSTTDWKRQVETRQYCFIVLPGTKHKIYCFVEGLMAFFVEEDLTRMRLRRSYDFQSETARMIARDENKLLKLRWKESFEIPDQAASAEQSPGQSA